MTGDLVAFLRERVTELTEANQRLEAQFRELQARFDDQARETAELREVIVDAEQEGVPPC